MEIITSALPGLVMFILALCLSPALFALINRCKAWFAGRQGPPLLQPYYDLVKLFRKGCVYSETTSWLFQAAPVVLLVTAVLAALITPLGTGAVWGFSGDFLVWVGLFAFARLILMLAALDTGSAFEGMGASREAWFSTLVEPALLLFFAATARMTGSFSLSDIFIKLSISSWQEFPTVQVFLLISLFLIILAENSRIPVDDPNTHLELTMIHEVMILDHSGPDLAIIHYASGLKLWVMSALFVKLIMPLSNINLWLNNLLFILTIFLVAVLIGIVESVMARLRLIRVPQLLVGAGGLSALSLILLLR